MTTSYIFTRARSRPTFHTMMTRTRKVAISETDVSSKKMKIQKKPHRYLTKPDTIARSFKGSRYALTACVDFSEAMGGGIAGGAFLRIRVGRLDDLLYGFPHAASERTFSMGNNIGKVLSVILSQWLNDS